jgi:ParB-like chromosome segregation protein Spo0J
MKRKMGGNLSPTSSAGTGKIEGAPSNKFAKGIAQQTDFAARIKEVHVKYVPTAYVKTDPKNPRKLPFSSDVIAAIVKSHPCGSQIASSDDTFWIKDYVADVAKAYDFGNIETVGFSDLVEFAAGIQSSNKLINPVTAWRNESQFHLICGERRFLAHLLFESDLIQCKYLDERPTETAIRSMQWRENEDRKDTNPYERLLGIIQLIESVGGQETVSISTLSQLIARGRSQTAHYLRLVRGASPLMLSYLKDKKIRDLNQASELVELSDEDLMDKVEGAKTINIAPSIRIAKTANKDAVKTLIETAVGAFGATQVLDGLDLSKSKHANEAMNRLLCFITEIK